MRRAFFTVLALASAFAAMPADSAGARPRPKTSRTAPFLTSDAARAAGLSPEEVKDATKLYTTKCMRCHKSYEPAAYGSAQWDSWMVKMSKKAHLTPDQENLLTRYLDAYRAGPPAAETNSAARR